MDDFAKEYAKEVKMIRQIRTVILSDIFDRLDALEKKDSSNFEIEDHREAIETMISEYINYNVTVTLEG